MNVLYLTHPLNGLIMIALPIGVGYFLIRRLKIGWSLWWAGCLTFIFSQITHIPFNMLILNPFIENNIYSSSFDIPPLILTSILLGFSAGIFEECARYMVYRWWQKDARSWAQGVIFGLGHGGAEAILLGILVLYTFIQMILLRNNNILSSVSEDELGLIQKQIELYWSVPWISSLLGAVERALTIPFHISASVIVLQALKLHQIKWLALAIIWHAILDATVLTAASLWGILAAEGLLGIIAIASVGIILFFREPYEQVAEVLPPLKEPLPVERIDMPDLSEESLEKTRFNRP